ncbi:MAG: hypothetical protein J2P54_09260, partial [Bradyrhizobiaceae bacterium]|nr:hypothetical protein [Bradyrhizobiaceae bacterium]
MQPESERLDTEPNRPPTPARDGSTPVEGNGERADDCEVREILRALQAMRFGDFSVRMPGDQIGIWGKVADTFNE